MSATVGAQELADLFGVHVRRIYQLVHEHVIPKGARGQYDLLECVRGYITLLQRVAEGKGRTVELGEEKLLSARLARRKLELEFAALEGSVVTVEHHKSVMGTAFLLVRTNMRNLAGTLPPRLAGLDEPRDVQRILIEAIDLALRSVIDASKELLSDELPPGFPGERALRKHGVERLSELMRVGDLEEVPGIGPATKERILDWLSQNL